MGRTREGMSKEFRCTAGETTKVRAAAYTRFMKTAVWLLAAVVLAGAVEAAAQPSALRRVPIARATQGGAYGVPPATTGARNVTVQASVRSLANAITSFYLDTGRLPTDAEGLSVLLAQPAGLRAWRGPYVALTHRTAGLRDPWGYTYRYQNTSAQTRRTTFRVYSVGPDGVAGTSDDIVFEQR